MTSELGLLPPWAKPHFADEFTPALMPSCKGLLGTRGPIGSTDGANVIFVVSAVEDPGRKPAVSAGFRGARYISAEASARGEWKPGGSTKPGFDAFATTKQAILAAALAFAREDPRLHINAIEPGFNPSTGLGAADANAFVRFLQKFVVPVIVPVLMASLLATSIVDVQDFRESMLADGAAPKTLNRRISSLSSFFKYLQGAQPPSTGSARCTLKMAMEGDRTALKLGAELRLPITVPNPAHAQFIARESPDARDETKALSLVRARQLMNLPSGESVLDYRDRAILKRYIYTGIRLATGCRLKVEDFHLDEGEATIKLHEKGNKHRTIGLNPVAAQAIEDFGAFQN